MGVPRSWTDWQLRAPFKEARTHYRSVFTRATLNRLAVWHFCCLYCYMLWCRSLRVAVIRRTLCALMTVERVAKRAVATASREEAPMCTLVADTERLADRLSFNATQSVRDSTCT